MTVSDDYLSAAEELITKFFKGKRELLMQASGSTKFEVKSDQSAVTVFDQQMELKLKEILMSLDSSIGFEGEEYGSVGNRETFWLTDPIDGTESFIRGLPYYRNMITLIDKGQPVFALVYRVACDEMFKATKGKGAFRNGQRLEASLRSINQARVELSTIYKDDLIWPVVKVVASKVQGIRTIDDFLFIVEGYLEAHLVFRTDTKPWDNAPRMLLLEETGMKVGNINSDKPYNYMDSNWLAARPEIYDELMPLINKIIKENS